VDTRHPNPQGSNPDAAPTEEQLLVGEMVGSTAFAAYLKSIVLPRIAEFRAKLLTDMELSPDERRVVMARMDEHRILLTRVFELTEAAELPPEIEKFFR
jgi:hypothetical protein